MMQNGVRRGECTKSENWGKLIHGSNGKLNTTDNQQSEHKAEAIVSA